MGGLRAEKIDDLGQPILRRVLRTQAVLRARERHPPVVFDERVGNLGDRKHKIHRARQDRVARHAVIGGLVGILRDNEPAFFLHGFQPEAA